MCDLHHGTCREEFKDGSSNKILGVSGILVASLGLILNSFGLYVLLRNKEKHMFHKLLYCLVTFDSCVLIFSILDAIYRGLKAQDRILVYGYPYFIFPGFYISVTCSIYMTICLSHERYSALKDPIRYSKTIELQGYQNRKIRKYLLATVCGSIVYNIFRFFEFKIYCVLKTVYDNKNLFIGNNVPIVSYTQWKDYLMNCSIEGDAKEVVVVKLDDINLLDTEEDNGIFIRATSYSDCFVLGIIPFLLLIYFNTRTSLCVKKQRERIRDLSISSTESKKIEIRILKNEIMMAICFMVIVTVFLICYAVNLIYGIISASAYMDNYETPQRWFFIMRDVGRLLIIVNSSVNILLYGFVVRTFREEIMETIQNQCLNRKSRSSGNQRTAMLYVSKSKENIGIPLTSHHELQELNR